LLSCDSFSKFRERKTIIFFIYRYLQNSPQTSEFRILIIDSVLLS
jgi:hypothetical protein